DIDTNATIPAAQLAANKLRAAAWFGLSGYAESDEEEETARPDDPDWNPLVWAWGQTIGNIARHIAHAAASDIIQTYNGDRDNDGDAANAAALAAMFEIPVDMIATRAADTQYTATRDEQDSEQDATEDTDGAPMEDFPEPADPVVPVDAETMIDPKNTITLENVSFLHILATAQ
ncbi:MAG: hypothetical protein LBS30_02015, partial [Planctomycetota bacterium]|nr:hypothetical protein [Planctomycetota bacterium]